MAQIRFRDHSGRTRIGTTQKTSMIKAAGQTYRWEDVTILPPTDPTKIICIGRNYSKHAEEMGNEIPDRPLLFFKTPNTVASHVDEIPLPSGKE
ncbi:MAG: fumarylacetoacetate hydrolase family protein, partial [Halobacteriaceae archaeon]